jgi:hypothetical protein
MPLMDEDSQQNVKPFLVRWGYLNGKSLDDNGQAHAERACLAEPHVSTRLKGGVRRSSRPLADPGWPGPNDDCSTRWRVRAVEEEGDHRGAR